MLEPRVYSVSQINRYIKNLMEKDFILQSMWVKGEISNFKAHSSGHLYFTLKDGYGAIQCMMFRGSAEILPFVPDNGMEVAVCGYVSIYEKTGQYQLYVELMQPAGLGALHLAYMELKEKLTAEGLFDSDYKREITENPRCLALITSPTGAAVRDMIQIIKRRDKGVKIVVVPVLVQGENAPLDIKNAIKLVNRWNQADTIILGRGGGSMEDLWAFNDERVARAIFASDIPVISAVGHETDFTIADLVADLRAPTPSAAAELAVKNQEERREYITLLVNRLHAQMEYRLQKAKENLFSLLNRPVLKRPTKQIYEQGIYLENLNKQLLREIKLKLKNNSSSLSHLQERLEGASPLSLLHRGYSIVEYSENNKLKTLSSALDVSVGGSISITVNDGRLLATVTKRQVAKGGK